VIICCLRSLSVSNDADAWQGAGRRGKAMGTTIANDWPDRAQCCAREMRSLAEELRPTG
jgi:hypothetical protein